MGGEVIAASVKRLEDRGAGGLVPGLGARLAHGGDAKVVVVPLGESGWVLGADEHAADAGDGLFGHGWGGPFVSIIA